MSLHGDKASAVAREIPLSDDARALLTSEQTPDQFLAAIDNRHLHADAIHFLSRWLSSRDAVWWACLCVWHTRRPGPTSKVEEEALQSALRWVVEPNERHRRAAEFAGSLAGLGTPAGCVAMAVFWSGGSISLPNLPVVEAPKDAASTTIAQAVLFSATGLPGENEHRRRFVQLGRDVAAGRNRWDQQAHPLAQS